MHGKTLLFVLAYLCGVFVGESSTIATDVAIFSFILACLHILLLIIFRKVDTKYNLSVASFLLFLGIVIGIVRVQFVEQQDVFVCEKVCTISGVIVKTPVQKDTYEELEIMPLSLDKEYEKILVRTTLYPLWHAGDIISLSGKSTTPEAFITDSKKQSFDYGEYLQSLGIGSQMYFPKIISDGEKDTHFIYTLMRVKDTLEERLSKYITSEASPLANGILFGDGSFTQESKDIFRISGLSHVVVLSGFNIAIVVAFMMLLFSFLPFVLRLSVTFLFTLLFVLAVGGEPSGVRAFLMAGIALFALYSGREYIARQALVISLLCMTLYDPTLFLSNVSFCLSFLATAGIIYILPPLLDFFGQGKKISFSNETLLGTLAAMCTTLPYITYTFGYVSTYALITNLLVVPLVPFAMLLSGIVICASFVSESLAFWIGQVTSYLLESIISVARFFASLPFSYIPVSISYTTMIVLYILIIIGYYLLRSFVKKRVTSIVLNEEEFEIIPY